jgi:type IV pilus assembly protein PilC
VTFLMIYLVPQMVTFLGNLGQELPTQTKVLIFISGVFVDFWWLLLALPIIAAVSVGIGLKQSARFRYQFDYMMLHMPVTGPILHKIIMARFARYFSLMYETGIPVLDAVKTCQDIVSNKVVADALERAYQQINAGDSMSESFRNAGLFPPLVVRMIKVGENTGALDKSLSNIGYFYDRDVNESIEKMLKLIEPALTVVLGGILAFIMFSVLGPVYDSFSRLKL